MIKSPKLKRKLEVKKYHGYEIKDEFSWVHQKNILDVLKDSSKLNPEVRKYLEEENAYTKYKMKDAEKFQKKLFKQPNLILRILICLINQNLKFVI